jgi:hypothetical protein
MEELNQFSIDRVKTSQIGSFMSITMQTGQGQIVQFRSAAMLAWNDVINMKIERKELRRELTILTTTHGPFPDQPG